MSIYSLSSAADLLRGNAYPGRGIIIGRTADRSTQTMPS